MINQPLISIIMPMFNADKFVEESILSVINQSYSNWELIICDDCSSDDSYKIAKKYSDRDKRVHLIQNDKNLGVAVARNKGLSITKGQYICLLDSDDLYDEEFLQKQLEFLRKNGQFVFCSFRRLAPNSTTNYIVPKRTTYKKILKGSCLTPLSVFIDKELIGESRFKENSEVEDFIFFLELLKKTEYAYGNKEVLASYRIVPNSRSRDKKKLIGKMWRVYHNELKFGYVRSLFYLICWGIHGLFKYRNVK